MIWLRAKKGKDYLGKKCYICQTSDPEADLSEDLWMKLMKT